MDCSRHRAPMYNDRPSDCAASDLLVGNVLEFQAGTTATRNICLYVYKYFIHTFTILSYIIVYYLLIYNRKLNRIIDVVL